MECDKRIICDLLNMPLMKLVLKYLGLPYFRGKSKSEAYTFIIDEKVFEQNARVESKVVKSGREEEMIKSAIQAIPCYASSRFLLPKKLCETLNSCVSNFWRKGDPECRGIHWNSLRQYGVG